MEILYGMDPLCGWCFGIGPAIRRITRDFPQIPVRPVLAGLVTGDRVGPYAQMEAYIRHASTGLQSVTGRAPSEAFFQMIRRADVRGDSLPPSVAIAAVRRAYPDQVLDFALRVTDAHFAQGVDLNAPQTYQEICRDMGLSLDMPDPNDHAIAQQEWQVGRALGLVSFPSLWLAHGAKTVVVPVHYDPARLSDALRALIRAA